MEIADALRAVPGESKENVDAMLLKLAAKRFNADDAAAGAFSGLSENALIRMGFDEREVGAIVKAQKVAAGVAPSESSRNLLSSDVLTVEAEGDVFYYVKQGERVTGSFYLDPDKEVARRILRWATLACQYLNNPVARSPLQPSQSPLVVSGFTKTGKSTTVGAFLPALLHTYGIDDHTVLLSGGGVPPPPERPGGIAWELWPVNCMQFVRTEGVAGFLRSLLSSLRRQARAFGFSDACCLPSLGDQFQDIMCLLMYLPADRMHVMVVDEAQSFFLLQAAGRDVLDRREVQEMRRSFKMLTQSAPAHVLWVFTGSTSNMIIANLAEAPVNGLSMLTHCDILHLPSSVSDETLALAWQLLKSADTSLPDALLLRSALLQHHAMLAYLCQRFKLEPQPGSPTEFFQRELTNKLLPELAADLRCVLALLEEKSFQGSTVGGELSTSNTSYVAQLLRLLDPSQGVPRSTVHRYCLETMKPYLKPVPGDEDYGDALTDDDMVYADCYAYQLLLNMITTADGKLVDSAMSLETPWAYTYWEMERLRQFGEHVKDAKAAGFKDYEDVQELLTMMAREFGDDINKQDWYEAVMARSKEYHEKMSKKYKKAMATPPEELTGVDAVQWGVINLRNSVLHNIGSHNPLLEACREKLVPFLPQMDATRLKSFLNPAKKPVAKVKPVAKAFFLDLGFSRACSCDADFQAEMYELIELLLPSPTSSHDWPHT